MDETQRKSAAEALQRAAKLCGSWKALADALEVSPMVVNNWKARGVSAARCLSIERLTAGAVKVHELRPDLYPAPTEEVAA